MFQNLALFPVPTAQKREGQKGAKSTLSYSATAFNYLWDHLYSSNTRQILQRQIIILKSYRQGFHKNYKKEGFTEIHLCDSNQSLIFPDFAT